MYEGIVKRLRRYVEIERAQHHGADLEAEAADAIEFFSNRLCDVRVYDPRGFEFEITVTVFILPQSHKQSQKVPVLPSGKSLFRTVKRPNRLPVRSTNFPMLPSLFTSLRNYITICSLRQYVYVLYCNSIGGDEMKVKFTTMIDEDMLSAIKIQAIKEKRTVSSILNEIIAEYLQKKSEG